MARKKEEKVNLPENATILQYAIGRRKRSVAKVRMYAGSGKVIINGKTHDQFITSVAHLKEFLKPLELAGMTDTHDFTAKVFGGGPTGQVEAVRMAIARCLAKINDDLKSTMRQNGFLTRDPREKERKKIYHIRARKSPQFSKR